MVMESQNIEDLVSEIKQTIEEVRAQIYTLQKQKRVLVENILILFDDFFIYVLNNIDDQELREKIKSKYFEMLNLIKQKLI